MISLVKWLGIVKTYDLLIWFWIVVGVVVFVCGVSVEILVMSSISRSVFWGWGFVGVCGAWMTRWSLSASRIWPE